MNAAEAEWEIRVALDSWVPHAHEQESLAALDFLVGELADAQSGDLWQKIQAQQKANDHLHRKYLTVKGDLRVRVAELARKDEALREIMADDALLEANPDAFGRYAWNRIREVARFALGEQA